MNRKKTRIMLLLVMITFATVIGGQFILKSIIPSFQVDYALNTGLGPVEVEAPSPQDNGNQVHYHIEDLCCGNVDTEIPSITIPSPPFKNFVVVGSTIDVSITDNNPMFSLKTIRYHWDTDTSNTTLVAEDPTNVENDLLYQIVVTSEVGTRTLYIYGEDESGNWATADFTFFVVLKMDKPSIEFISPATDNETLTDVNVFVVNASDDLGLIEVKLQINNSASLRMKYNKTSGYYHRSVNVSKLTNGSYLVNVTAVDIDFQQHSTTESINITVTGGQSSAIVSSIPEWDSSRSVLPENISTYIDASNFSNYIAETGNIYFKVAIKDLSSGIDDDGIIAVDFTVYGQIDDFDPNTTLPSSINVRKEFSESLNKSGSDGDWDIYEYNWDSNSSLDNYYLCVLEIQDNDEVANHLYVGILIEVDNVAGDEPTTTQGRRSPGFEIELIVLIISSWAIITILIKQKPKK